MRQYKYDVFISYSMADLCFEDKSINPDSIVSKIIQCLNEHNISYWIDLEGIYTGNEFAEKIAVAIEESRTFLFVSSPNSNKSEWTPREIGCASDIKYPIIPFRVTSDPYSTSIRLFLAHLDYIDYEKLGEKAFQILTDSLSQHLDVIKRREAEEQRRIQQDSEAEENARIKKRERELQQAKLISQLSLLEKQESSIQEQRDLLILEMQRLGMDIPASEEGNIMLSSQTYHQLNNQILELKEELVVANARYKTLKSDEEAKRKELERRNNDLVRELTRIEKNIKIPSYDQAIHGHPLNKAMKYLAYVHVALVIMYALIALRVKKPEVAMVWCSCNIFAASFMYMMYKNMSIARYLYFFTSPFVGLLLFVLSHYLKYNGKPYSQSMEKVMDSLSTVVFWKWLVIPAILSFVAGCFAL